MIFEIKKHKGSSNFDVFLLTEYIDSLKDGVYYIEVGKLDKKRTLLQNNSIHLYCHQLGEALNEAGWDMRKTLKPTYNIPWMTETVKEFIWKTIQKALLRKKSTRELTTTEVSKVYEVVNREIGEKTGVHVPFPHKEDGVDN